jgi:glycosyltransferase involved in cell wall biosynthesis
LTAARVPDSVLFAYWGRRGALSRFTLNLARACQDIPNLDATISVSRQNEMFEQFLPFGPALLPVNTFASAVGALANPLRLLRLRRDILHRLARDRARALVTLMPHVWSPLVAPAVRRIGVRYLTIIHDADPHTGDPTSIVHGWLLRDARHADLVITLSESVAARLQATARVSRNKLVTLFHPDLDYASSRMPIALPHSQPFRCLFFGRIMPYKNLPLFLDAVEILRNKGVPVEAGIYGEGELGSCAERIRRLKAECVNEWIADDAVAHIFARFHAVVLSNTEASQSGVAAAALARGVPVIATPAGGLPEQVKDGETGVMAKRADAPSVAEAIQRLALDAQLYRRVRENIARTREGRSMRRFAEELVALAVRPRDEC